MSRIVFFIPIAFLMLAACSPTTTPVADMPNPASVYCEENGGSLELRTDASGGVAGVCVFPDGSECDEWAYYRGECRPGDSLATAETAADGCLVYRNDEMGYSFHYPAEAVIQFADDPRHTLTVVGPLFNDDHWPIMYLNHPLDREDYRVPEGADLAQWLSDHNLITGERLAGRTIAGTAAVHTRLPRSPQSYASDTFYFVHTGQLYSVVILHTADKEDWAVYDHFLDSIAFGE